jgi:hypothetical protein
MSRSVSQEELKTKYNEYCGKPTALHQRAHDYLNLRNEPTEILTFLLIESEAKHEGSQADSLALQGLRSAIQAIISDRIARRQEEMTLKLDRTGRLLAMVGIGVALVGATATIISLFV